MEGLILLVVVFVSKVIDNLIGTLKTLFIQRNKAFLAALALFVSNLIYYSVIKTISNSDGFATVVVTSVASSIGCYIAIKIADKFSKDRMYTHTLMSDDLDTMRAFRDFLAEHHIDNVATDSYTLDWSKKTITITAYAETKAESRLIDSFINSSGTKIKKIMTKN